MADNAVSIKLVGLDSLKASLLRLRQDLGGRVLRDALMAGANMYKDAIENATPTDTGQARRNVIIYKRKGYEKQLFGTAEELSLLVGYQKKKAFYMYFQEYGWTTKSGRRIPGRTNIRSVIRSTDKQALRVAEGIIAAAVAREAMS